MCACQAPLFHQAKICQNEGQTFDPHPHPGGFTKLPECPVASLVAVLGFSLAVGVGVKRLALTKVAKVSAPRRADLALVRGNHLSNTTCTTQVFFKSDQSYSNLTLI